MFVIVMIYRPIQLEGMSFKCLNNLTDKVTVYGVGDWRDARSNLGKVSVIVKL